MDLQQIIAPGLNNPDYGAEINKQFENINNNFQKLANYDFVRGRDAEMNLDQISAYDDQVYFSIKQALIDFHGDLFEDQIELDPSSDNYGNFKGFDGLSWDTNLNEDKVTLIKNENGEVVSSLVYVYIDPRFSNPSTENASKYINTSNLSCAMYFQKDKFVAVSAFPTLAYDKDLNCFVWKIYGNETNIIANGPKGEPGKDAKILMSIINEEINVDNFGYTEITELWDPLNINDPSVNISDTQLDKSSKYPIFIISSTSSIGGSGGGSSDCNCEFATDYDIVNYFDNGIIEDSGDGCLCEKCGHEIATNDDIVDYFNNGIIEDSGDGCLCEKCGHEIATNDDIVDYFNGDESLIGYAMEYAVAEPSTGSNNCNYTKLWISNLEYDATDFKWKAYCSNENCITSQMDNHAFYEVLKSVEFTPGTANPTKGLFIPAGKTNGTNKTPAFLAYSSGGTLNLNAVSDIDAVRNANNQSELSSSLRWTESTWKELDPSFNINIPTNTSILNTRELTAEDISTNNIEFDGSFLSSKNSVMTVNGVANFKNNTYFKNPVYFENAISSSMGITASSISATGTTNIFNGITVDNNYSFKPSIHAKNGLFVQGVLEGEDKSAGIEFTSKSPTSLYSQGSIVTGSNLIVYNKTNNKPNVIHGSTTFLNSVSVSNGISVSSGNIVVNGDLEADNINIKEKVKLENAEIDSLSVTNLSVTNNLNSNNTIISNSIKYADDKKSSKGTILTTDGVLLSKPIYVQYDNKSVYADWDSNERRFKIDLDSISPEKIYAEVTYDNIYNNSSSSAGGYISGYCFNHMMNINFNFNTYVFDEKLYGVNIKNKNYSDPSTNSVQVLDCTNISGFKKPLIPQYYYLGSTYAGEPIKGSLGSDYSQIGITFKLDTDGKLYVQDWCFPKYMKNANQGLQLTFTYIY